MANDHAPVVVGVIDRKITELSGEAIWRRIAAVKVENVGTGRARRCEREGRGTGSEERK